MDENFSALLQLYLTVDANSQMSSREVYDEIKTDFPTATLLVTSKALDALCGSAVVPGCPNVSMKGGNAKSPVRIYPLRWISHSELVRKANVLIVVAMSLEMRVAEESLNNSPKDVKPCFPEVVDSAVVGTIMKTPVLIVKTRDYGSLDSYAATTIALFLAREVTEVLKVGTAVYMMNETSEKEEVSIGDLCIMDGTHSKPLLTIVPDDYDVMKSYSHSVVNPPFKMREWREHVDFSVEGRRIHERPIMSGKYFRPEKNELPNGCLGEMEIAGMIRATICCGRIMHLGAISVITEIFNSSGIVERFNSQNKSVLASTLTTALRNYMAYKA